MFFNLEFSPGNAVLKGTCVSFFADVARVFVACLDLDGSHTALHRPSYLRGPISDYSGFCDSRRSMNDFLSAKTLRPKRIVAPTPICAKSEGPYGCARSGRVG